MEHIYKTIVESIASGKIDKKTAIALINMIKKEESKPVAPIAIIGMALRLPMADCLPEYWEIIHNGVDCIKSFPQSRRGDIDQYLRYIKTPEEQIRYNKNAYLEEIDKFDYKFFRLSPREAALMDPNQRLFLETAYHAFEDAGYGGKKLAGSNTGVYMGFAPNLRDMYERLIYEVNPEDVSLSAIGNLTAALPSRISYIMDLKGPCMVVDSACSASIVALDLACQAIRNGKCNMAIAGGIKINTVPLDREYMKIGIESSDDHTRAFDDSSDGSGIGEGAGVIVLKSLDQALQDQDHIYAVIKGSAVNQDGSSAGITAPNPAAQADVIASVWQEAGIDPESISYIETHGTGTQLGDPIEIQGIKSAFKRFTNKKQFCAISSVKTNLGHLSEPAGIISLIKAVLALNHKELPPSLYFQRPNRAIDFATSPIYVNTNPRKWKTTNGVRRCGVSAFGISGTNSHIVLEEAPEVADTRNPNCNLLILSLSAKDKDRLAEMVVNFYDFLVKNAKADVRDICYTANTGRGHYGCRLVMIAANRDDLTNKMKRLTNCSLSEVNVSGVFYGDHKIISQSKKNRSDKEITESEKREFSHKADEQINRFIQCGGQDKELLTELCNLYINGADIDWEKMYSSEMVKKVSLPGYPFERTRCWLTIPDQAIANEKLSYENFYYTMGWCKEPIRTAASVMTSGSILLLKDQKGMGVQISKRLHQKGLAVIEVEIGDHYQNKNECCFTISSQEADFERMFDEIGDRKITQVIHLSTLNGAMVSDTCELQRCQERGVNSLIFLTRVLVRRQPDHELDTVLVSSYVNEVTGQEERISPENAPLLAFGRVINKEHPQMGCRGIDIDDFVTPDDLMAEMNVKGNEYISALRKGERFVEEFKPLYPEEFTKQEVLFCEEGVYIITGGTGGMGLAMAQYMAARSKIRVALINRSQMPPFEQWEKILQSGQDKGMCQKIRSINVLKAYGAEVLLYSANVAKEDEMQTIFRDLKTRFGRINGVIHAAGVGGSGMIANRSKADADEIISPKVYGTFVIDKLTREEDLDFFVMCSSVSSMFSAPAQGDYMSANAYQDAYAAYRNKLGKRTLTINWTTWKEVGMAANHNATFDTIFKALPTARAMSGFDQVFHRDIKRVLLGEIHYKSKMIHILERFQFKLSDLIQKELLNHRVPDNKNRKSKSAGSSAEVILMGKDSGEYLEVERKLAKITQEVLGFDEIDVYESFFEMGADSILLTRMYNDLDKEFPDQLTLVDLFSYTTISELALFLMGRDETDFDVDDEVKEFEAMFEKIEEGNLSIDEALENIYNQ